MLRSRFVLIFEVMLLGALLQGEGGAQPLTVPQSIARGMLSRFTTPPSGAPPTIDELLLSTDMVVIGTIGEPRSYLSEDQLDVLTDYPVMNARILSPVDVFTARKPESLATVTVTQLGGTLLLGGQTFTQTEAGLAPLSPGIQALLLLKRIGEKYRIAGTYFGVFEIAAGRLRPLVNKRTFALNYRDAPAEQAAAEMVARLPARAK